MRELSLHVLDILQNSIAAGATRIVTTVVADEQANKLVIRITDNGKGMSPEFLAKITDPFVTTRTTRKVGLGIPMLAAATEASGGGLRIDSELGRGTTVEATFELNHIDRAPFGDIASTMITTIIANPSISFRYEQRLRDREFTFDTDEVKSQLEDVSISDPLVVKWMINYITENIASQGAIN